MSEGYFTARDVERLGKEFASERLRFLREARQIFREMGYGDIANLKVINSFGQIDASKVRGLDDVAMSLRFKYPEVLGQDEFTAAQRLFDLLVIGNPEPVKNPVMVEAGHKAHETRRKAVRHG